jgi:hypothetical protein
MFVTLFSFDNVFPAECSFVQGNVRHLKFPIRISVGSTSDVISDEKVLELDGLIHEDMMKNTGISTLNLL